MRHKSHKRRATALLAMSGLLGAGVASAATASAATAELPVYEVRGAGLDERQAAALQNAFGLKSLERSEDGSVRFLDEASFLHVPTLDKGEGKPDEDGNPTRLTALDFAAIKQIRAIPTEDATRRTLESLRGAGLLPSNGQPSASHTTFEATDAQGSPTATAPLDTTVAFSFTVDGVPLEGPGAKVRVSYDGRGQVTHLSYSTRELARGASVTVLDLAGGRERCAKALGDAVRVEQVSYTYVAPALEEKTARLEPSFKCVGLNSDGSPAQVVAVPAAVNATLPAPQPVQPPREPASFGTQSVAPVAVGSEGTGPCSGLPHTAQNVGAFNNGFTSKGVPVQFSWLDQNAWESDFKDPVFPGGEDSTWADDVDMTYWQGHGSPTGFYFSGCSNHNDTKLANTDARWGQRDVEWMSLFTCLILKKDDGGKSWAQRWGQAFRGLHQINSFDTISWHSKTHGGIFAKNMLKSSPMKVRSAWAQAAIETQTSKEIWATMGVYSGGAFTNIDDYFWGKGAVGPDTLPTGGFWRISGTS